jgi:hypothetical protein
VTLKVVGTGFGRTGTDSMRKALNILGVGPTHHMLELGAASPLREPWLDLVERDPVKRDSIKAVKPDWEMLFAGYHSCVDWPSAFYWRSLVTEYPDAKVLLTMRSAESWWSSFEATILKNIQTDDDHTGFSKLLVSDQVFEGRPYDKDHAIALYNRNVEEVMDTVDTERLLVHNLGDGWEPLCKWLELTVPEIEYPYGNTSKEFIERMAP